MTAHKTQARVQFIDAVALGYSPGEAAKRAGVDASTPYRWRRQDVAFAASWQAARPETTGMSEAQDEFLLVLADLGNVRQACASSGISRANAYVWRKDPLFESRWQEAIVQAVDPPGGAGVEYRSDRISRISGDRPDDPLAARASAT